MIPAEDKTLSGHFVWLVVGRQAAELIHSASVLCDISHLQCTWTVYNHLASFHTEESPESQNGDGVPVYMGGPDGGRRSGDVVR